MNMDNYTIHTAIKCSDGNVHRLSYDLIEQTEGSVREFGRLFAEIEKRFPDVQFWIKKGHESIYEPLCISYIDPTNNLGFNKNTDNEV